MGVIRSFNCCAERGLIFAVLLKKLGDGESLQEAEPLIFVDQSVKVLSHFIKFFCSVLFTRLFLT